MASGLLQMAVTQSFLLFICSYVFGDEVSMKIVEGPTIQRYGFQQEQEPTLRTHPAALKGPAHLLQLNGTCLKQAHEGYEYKVCPFHNVTQKEEGSRYGRYHGVLGVFRDWIVENDSLVGMQFVMGDSCGLVSRQAQVFFHCSTGTALTNISEVQTCRYSLSLHSPLACFPAAATVPSLLSAGLVAEWERLGLQQEEGLLARQGLVARRRTLLQEAGMAYRESMIKPAKFDVTLDSTPALPSLTEGKNEELRGLRDLVRALKTAVARDNVTISDVQSLLNRTQF